MSDPKLVSYLKRKSIDIAEDSTMMNGGLVPGNEKQEDRDVVYVDKCAVAPAPSRDYYRLYVDDHIVRLTCWSISHQYSHGGSQPSEAKVALQDYEKEHELVSEVLQIFGSDMGRYVMGLSQGHKDTIIRLPEEVLAHIFSQVGIENLSKLAPVCKRFSEVCAGNSLWKRFYRKHMVGPPTSEEFDEHVERFGWKTAFLHHKLQNIAFDGKKMKLGTSGISVRRSTPVPASGDNDDLSLYPPPLLSSRLREVKQEITLRHRENVPQPAQSPATRPIRPRSATSTPEFCNVTPTNASAGLLSGTASVADYLRTLFKIEGPALSHPGGGRPNTAKGEEEEPPSFKFASPTSKAKELRTLAGLTFKK